MRYKNIRTNNYVETDGVIYGELWELVKETEKKPTEETESVEPVETKRKTKAKAK